VIGSNLDDMVGGGYQANEESHSVLYSIGIQILNLGISLALLANAASATSLDRIEYDLLANSYLSQENALEARIRLEGAGYFPYLTKARVDGKEFTRVIVDVNGSQEEVQNVGEELVQKGLIGEYEPIEDTKDANIPEILSKRGYLPKKTPETNPRIENVLILYTEASQNDSPLTTLERAKLFRDLIASHWDINTHMKLVQDYEKGEIDNFDVLMYIGENYRTRIPRSLINDANNTSKEILWINYHPWKLNTKKLGFKVSDKHSRDFDRISYRNYDFKLNPTDTSLVHLTNPAKAEVLAWLVDDETGKRNPAIVNANENFLYVSYLPPAIPYLDEQIPFFNALHETFGHHEKQATALIRLEDLNQYTYRDTQPLNDLGNYLLSENIPFHFGIIPRYINPAKDMDLTIDQDMDFLHSLRLLISKNGVPVLHGYTHQYDGETGIDFEFWDESKNKPIEGDSEEFAQKRVISALNILKKAKLSTDIWETPHYKASEVDYKIFKKIFPIIYDDRNGINVPFIFKRDNTIFSPFTLYSLSSLGSINGIITNAKKIYDCFEDPSISFFYHPYLFRDKELGEKSLNRIINSLRDMGYEFRSIYDLLEKEKSFEEKVILAKRSFQKGIDLVAYSKDTYFSYQINKELDHWEDVGVEWVRIQTLIYQKNISSSSIFVDREKTASDESLEYIISKLHKRGFKVLFAPVVNLEHQRRGEWMGMIRPDDWDLWFENYSGFIEHYAKLAQKNEVEQFVIGVELNSTHKYKEEWEQIIDNTRKHYQGVILFVSNFDAYETVPFWDKLDVIAMNFYFPINRRDDWYQPWAEVKDGYHNPSYEDLLDGWQLWVATLDRWQERMNKPILVTEAGYASQRGCTYQPWSWYLGESNFEEQYLAYKALYEVWSKKQIVNGKSHGGNYLQGIYFFHWADEKPANDRSYVPSQEAKSIIGKWFTGTESSEVDNNG